MSRVTITGLASKLGISKASVSYALNGQPGVSEETRKRVLALARELGWYPSSSARALSKSKAGAVGIVLSREPELISSEPYYMSLIAGIESVLIETETSLLLRVTGGQEGGDLAVYQRWAGERRVDGVILFDHLIDDPRPELLTRLGLPFVLHGASTNLPGTAATTVDQSADARTLVEHLHQLGHLEIGHVSGPLRLQHERLRREAVIAHSQEAAMHVVSAEADYTMDGAQRATEEMLARGTARPTAIIYGSDLMALGGLAGCRRTGLPVPEEVSVVSWDNSMLCSVSSPSITALQRDPFEQGRLSAGLLLDVIAGRGQESVVTPPSHLILRESSGPSSGSARC